MVAGRFSSPYSLTTATLAPLPQELDVSHVDVVAEPGLSGLGLVGAAYALVDGTRLRYLSCS